MTAMTLTVPEYMAQQTERLAEAMTHFLDSTADDRLDWRPVAAGVERDGTGADEVEIATTRSALEQIEECIHTNRAFAELIREGATTLPTGGSPELTSADRAEAQRLLKESAAELAAAMRSMTDEDLARTYPHPRAAMLGANLIMNVYRNMAYHAGQINYIQTLYGDTEFHVPPNWR